MSEWSHKYVVYDAFAPGMVSWGKLLMRGSAKFNSKDSYKEHHYTLDGGGVHRQVFGIFFLNKWVWPHHTCDVQSNFDEAVCMCMWVKEYVYIKYTQNKKACLVSALIIWLESMLLVL